MRKRPLLLAAAVFLLGICWGSYRTPLPLAAALILGLYCVLDLAFSQSGWTHRKIPRSIGLLLLLSLLFTAGTERTAALSSQREKVLTQLEDRQIVTVLGTVAKKDHKNDQLIYELENVQLALSSIYQPCGKIRVTMSDTTSDSKSVTIQSSLNRHAPGEASHEKPPNAWRSLCSKGTDLTEQLPKSNFSSELHNETTAKGSEGSRLDAVGFSYYDHLVAFDTEGRDLDSEGYSIGTTLLLKGSITLFSIATNEGAFDQREFYHSQGIWFGMWDPQVLRSTPYEGYKHSDYRLRDWLYRLRLHFLELLGELMGEENAGVLAGMLIGDRNQIDAETKLAYRNAGISHINAISALHISIFAMSLYRLLRKRGTGFWISAVGSGCLIWMYALMTGNSLSTRRAVACFLIMAAGEALGRSYDMMNALGGWVLLALWENPFLIHYSGFIFSVTAVMGIGVTVKVLELSSRSDRSESSRDQDDSHSRDHWFSKLKESLISGVGIQITTLPVVAYYYYEIPTYAVFLNLLVIPLMSVVLISGAAALAAAHFWLLPGKLLILPADGILTLYRRLCDWTLKLPMAQVIVGQPSLSKMLFYYGGLAFLLLLIWKSQTRILAGNAKGGNAKGLNADETPDRRPGMRKKILVFACFTALILFLYHPPALGEEVDVLDVGQGLGIFISARDGHTIFIDGGSTSEKQVGTYQILPFLKSKGIRQIDYWCISHADQDHISGVEEVFQSGYSTSYLVLADAMPKDAAYRGLVQSAQENDVEVVFMHTGQRIVMGEEDLVCLFPDHTSKMSLSPAASFNRPDTHTLSASQRQFRRLPSDLSLPRAASASRQNPHTMTASPDQSSAEFWQTDSEDTSSVDRNKLCLTLLLRADSFTCLFPGDLSTEEEILLLDNPLLGSVDLFAASHHGSRYSNSRELLSVIRPKVAAVSCGLRNRYGHPGAEAVENMENAGAAVYYTMYSGQLQMTGKGNRKWELRTKLVPSYPEVKKQPE